MNNQIYTKVALEKIMYKTSFKPVISASEENARIIRRVARFK